MKRSLFFILVITIIGGFSFFYIPPSTPADEVKAAYIRNANELKKETSLLKNAIVEGKDKAIRTQFHKARAAYKKIEVITEYFFEFYANKINGAPIPFYKEDAADVMFNEPYGFQVIEELIFPLYNKSNKEKAIYHATELDRYVSELLSVNESYAFNDANIIDALMEGVYRVTAISITGFDSQTAGAGLKESADVLTGLNEYISYYKPNFVAHMPGRFEEIQSTISGAITYLQKNNDFNSFDRMHFILTYLNPTAKIIGEYKKVYELEDNSSGPFYSAITKNNTLFAQGAFNVNRFLDDFTTNADKVELGRRLFYETALSSNKNRSCASCHAPGKAFTDGLKTSVALDGHSPLPRNAPTLWNAALQRNLFHDSRGRNMEDQVMQVLNNSLEMHGSAQLVSEMIINKPEYKSIYNTAYPDSKTEDAAKNISNAIACFERTLVALNSRFDKHMNGQPSLTADEISGFNLFMGKAKCGTCHFTPLFSGAKPPRYYFMESEVIGVPATTDKKNPRLDQDSGRYRVTGSPIHLFSFKTATIRNIELTAPYMHNGVFNTLEEVVDFYNDGGGTGLKIAPGNQSLPPQKLDLSKKEKRDLIAFMRSLTDTTMITSSNLK